jgi:hypothetical protein
MHLRVLFVNFVKGLFASAPSGCYRWTSDDETTELYVTDEETIQPVVVERLPTITFTRGPIQFYSLGLDDLEQYDFATNRKTKGVLLPGTMTVNCCSRVSLESEHLAFVVAEHIWLLRDLLMKAGFFEVGRSIQVGSPTPAGTIIADDRGDEFFCTAVSVPFQFARLSSFTPLGLTVVNSIEQSLNVLSPRTVESLGASAQTHEYPFSVSGSRPESFAPNARDLKVAACNVQPHPLNPSRLVQVKVVRPNRSSSRLISSGAAIPIPRPCVEQSTASVPARTQKG